MDTDLGPESPQVMFRGAGSGLTVTATAAAAASSKRGRCMPKNTKKTVDQEIEVKKNSRNQIIILVKKTKRREGGKNGI